MIKETIILIVAVYFGGTIGFYGSVICSIWAVALYTVVGKGRNRYSRSSAPDPHPPASALKRLLLNMPWLVFIHPLPWALAGIAYLTYLLFAVPMRPGQFVLGISVLGGFAYGLVRMLLGLNDPTKQSTRTR